MGDKETRGKADTPSNKGSKKGHKGRQDLGKAETPSNTGTHAGETMGENGRQGTQRPREGERTIQHRHTYVGRQGETRPREGGHPIQRRHTCGGTRDKTSPREGEHIFQRRHKFAETMGHNGRQLETRGDKTSARRTYNPTKGDKKEDHARQDRRWTRLRQKHTCGETMGDDGRQWDTPSEHRHACGETMGERETRVDKTLGSRTHHPTQAHMWGDKGRQDLGKAGAPSNTGTHVGRQEKTRGEKTSGGRQWEAMGDKTLGRARFVPRIFSAFLIFFFPFNAASFPSLFAACYTSKLPFRQYLQHFGTTSMVIEAFLEQETDGKSSIVELAARFFSREHLSAGFFK